MLPSWDLVTQPYYRLKSMLRSAISLRLRSDAGTLPVLDRSYGHHRDLSLLCVNVM